MGLKPWPCAADELLCLDLERECSSLRCLLLFAPMPRWACSGASFRVQLKVQVVTVYKRVYLFPSDLKPENEDCGKRCRPTLVI